MGLPRKIELLQNDLVAINQQHQEVVTNTLQIAEYFKKRPSSVNQRVASLSIRELLKLKPSYYLNQQGKQQKYHQLNCDLFLLVVMGFTGNKVAQFKTDFIKLFNSQEAELRQWRKQALLATDSTNKANDSLYQLQGDLKDVIPDS
jgi:Rha family phage regulatory protein